MTSLTLTAKLQEVLQKAQSALENIQSTLVSGNMYLFEEELTEVFTDLYNKTATAMLEEAAVQSVEHQKVVYELGGTGTRDRKSVV